MRWVLVAFLIVLLCGCASGLFDSHVKLMDQIGGMAAQTTQALAEGSPVQYMASGEAVEPGVVVEVGQTYFARSYFKGLGGTMSAAGAGLSRDLTSEQWSMVETIWRDKSMADADKRQKVWSLIDKWLTEKSATTEKPTE